MKDRYDPEMALVRAEMYLPAAAKPLVEELRALRRVAEWCRGHLADTSLEATGRYRALEQLMRAVDAVTEGR